MVSRERVLQRPEIMAVLDRLHRFIRLRGRPNTRLNLTVFRLSCCCGLRSCEIRQLRLKDLKLGGDAPLIRIPAGISKGTGGKRGAVVRKGRLVPLWCDDTRDDLLAWQRLRTAQGAEPDDLLIASVIQDKIGKPMTRGQLAYRWKTALKALPADRRDILSIHCGRHSFITHAIYAGIPLPLVQKAAGHASIHTTNQYVHVLDLPIPRRDLFSPGYMDQYTKEPPEGSAGPYVRLAV